MLVWTIAAMLGTTSIPAQDAQWPLEGPVKTPSKALQIPTKLDPVDQSLTAILDGGGKIVSSYIGRTGPVVTTVKRGKYVVCVLVGANPQVDQNVATSECYALN